MKTQKYAVNQYLIEVILSWVKAGEIAIPEIQRPFVWDATKVRDLLDSLYQGFPIGYLIAWRNPDIKLKDGTTSTGKKILIDGQQRVMALTAAILGEYVVNKNYKRIKIKIAFNPLKEKFEVTNPAILKDAEWIPDVAPIISGDERVTKVIRNYLEKNPTADEEVVEDAITNLTDLIKKQVGLIELDSDLDIETVTEIFIRINSKGVVLSQADFAMSKIAANETYGGSTMRKGIDYFCHLAITPDFYNKIVDIDTNFAQTNYFQKMAWLRHENDDLYDPSYTDLLRVAFTSEFNRGKLSDLVSLLSGRNFETRTFEEEIAEQSFRRLEQGILNFMNETNFMRFIMIIKSAGFIVPSLIRSQNALNFAYIIYLKLKSYNFEPALIEKYVRKWFVLSMLTGRYSGSAETVIDYDIRQTSAEKFEDYFDLMERSHLGDSFWEVSLVQSLNTSGINSPFFNVFLAAQVKANDKGFLSRDITVKDLIIHKGDIHHIFPSDYLKKKGLQKWQYNQIANYVFMQSEINIRIGNKAPNLYFHTLLQQCETKELHYGGIDDGEDLRCNLKANGIPETVFDYTIEHFDQFLLERRRLMAAKMKAYYYAL